eukprot:m.333642 g.333642  ORF g.333642 m.333642 type:complete len:149 (+) comp17187_c0_seq1:707-1153(+)
MRMGSLENLHLWMLTIARIDLSAYRRMELTNADNWLSFRPPVSEETVMKFVYGEDYTLRPKVEERHGLSTRERRLSDNYVRLNLTEKELGLDEPPANIKTKANVFSVEEAIGALAFDFVDDDDDEEDEWEIEEEIDFTTAHRITQKPS